MRISLFFGLLLSCGSLFAAGELSNRRAPGFSLPDVQFKQHDIADYRGRAVIIDLMKTDCPHCVTFARVLELAKAKYGNRLVVLSVVTPPDTMQTVQRFQTTNFLTYPVLFDCGQMSASYMRVTPQNPTVTLPHVFLIDAQGTIRNDFGYDDRTKQYFEQNAFFQEIDKLLAAPKK